MLIFTQLICEGCKLNPFADFFGGQEHTSISFKFLSLLNCAYLFFKLCLGT